MLLFMLVVACDCCCSCNVLLFLWHTFSVKFFLCDDLIFVLISLSKFSEVLFGDYEETPFHGIGKAGFLICDKQLGVGGELQSDPAVLTL